MAKIRKPSWCWARTVSGMTKDLLPTIHVGHSPGLAQHLKRLVHEFLQLLELSAVRQRLGAFHDLAHCRRVLAAALPALNPCTHPLDLCLNADLRVIQGEGLLHQRLSRQELVVGHPDADAVPQAE